MGDNIDRWLSRSELAERYGLPIKTLAQWASKETGPRYARMVDLHVLDSPTARHDRISASTRTILCPTTAH
jgi:hypothetical protein